MRCTNVDWAPHGPFANAHRARAETRVWRPASRLVPPERTRPPVASHARPISRARVGADAAADAGRSRRRLLRDISRALPHARGRRSRHARPGDGVVAGTWLLRARPQSP